MNPVDLIIIYLACGAPFGVYYFLKHRTKNLLWLKSFLNFVFWMPFALLLLGRRVNTKRQSAEFDKTSLINSKDAAFNLIPKAIERILIKSSLKISIYEFREIFERYVGLTIAGENGDARIAEHEKEIFRVSQAKNISLGSICLNRHNRKRLSTHQTEAREDFLFLIDQLQQFGADKIDLQRLAISLTKLLKDFEAQYKLEKMFAASLHSDERPGVVELEKDLWNPEIPKKPLPAEQILHLQAMNHALNLRSED